MNDWSTNQTKQQNALNRFAAGAVLLAFVLLIPRPACAHGELLIQIAALTRQIEANTNGLAELYLARGELHRLHQSWEEATADYDHAATFDANLVRVDFCRAKLLEDRGELAASEKMFSDYLSRAPDDGEGFVERARVRAKLSERAKALVDYRRGLELLNEPVAEYFSETSVLLALDGKTNEALAILDVGIKKLGPVVTLQLPALELELDRGNYDIALARLETLIKPAIRKERWLVRRGKILVAAGHPAEARRAFNEALAAITVLPWRLQQGHPMLKLKAEINQALAELSTFEQTSVTQNPAK